MAKLTDEKIAELRALCEKATPGEYKVATWRAGESVSVAIVAGVDDGDEYIVAEMMAEDDQAEIDARQLVAARTALPDLLSDLEEARRQRDEALARPIYQCTNCGVIRFNKFEACVCGAAAQQLPRDLFKQLIEHLRSVQQELDADFTGR